LTDKGADAEGIARLVCEWQQGIELKPSTAAPSAIQRTAPVKELEAAGGEWRAGPTMRKIIFKRKPIWLAFERRVRGHPRTQGGEDEEKMSQEAAIEDLELLAR
jgi:hypothetical protein